MLVGPVHQEQVWTRSSQREPARSNIHTSTTALGATTGRSHKDAIDPNSDIGWVLRFVALVRAVLRSSPRCVPLKSIHYFLVSGDCWVTKSREPVVRSFII